MKRKIFLITLIAILLSSLSVTNVEAKKIVEVPQQVVSIDAKKMDNRAFALKNYLEKQDSPLQNNAQDFIDAADTYNLDWKLLPAISGVESTFGKATPGGYNGWGWGVYGTQARYFASWKNGIFEVSKGLRENYVNRGLNSPYEINRVYAASSTWGSKVSYFMQDLEKFSQKNEPSNEDQILAYKNVDAKTQTTSAKLELRTKN